MSIATELSPLPRRIIVSHRLPLRALPDPSSPYLFSFSIDYDALPLQLSTSLPFPPLFIGTLPFPPPHDPSLCNRLCDYLLSQFNCMPVFIPSDVYRDFYYRFCMNYLWPLFHSLLPGSSSSTGGLPFDHTLYRSYMSANELFAERIIDVFNVQDFIWVHDYHLITLPTFLRRKFPRVKVGFFLHSPFPTSEIFRTIPVRDDLLWSLLNSDMVGFHTCDYARNFLSSCLTVLGLRYQHNGGYIGIDYHCRHVIVKILPVGVNVGQLQWIFPRLEISSMIKELRKTYKDRVLMVSVDDPELFIGIKIKVLAMEQVLKDNPELQGRLVLVQITNTDRKDRRDLRRVREEINSIRDRINTQFRQPGYEPVVILENRQVSMNEKAAFYAIADCCIVNVVYDGMTRIPYTYTVCREHSPALYDCAKKSVLIVSEFIGCSPSLSGAIRINPWDKESVSEGLISAITMPEMEKQLRHEKHYRYINSRDVVYWAQTFHNDLQRACEENSLKNYFCLGSGMRFEAVALGSGFYKLPKYKVVDCYKKTCNRLVLLDYDGTMVPRGVTDKRPTEEVLQVVKGLCADPLNVVFVVSGRSKVELAKWFEPCEKLGIAAEHGYYIRWDRESPWEISNGNNHSLALDWMGTVLTLMEQYTKAIDGSFIEEKHSALVWHYQDADPDFGSCQAKELFENLESILANKPAVVKRGHKIVEVNPQGISKGVVVETLISTMEGRSKVPDFLLCLGDDSSDEDMFESLKNCMNNPRIPEIAGVFACTVGIKPSMANYFLDNTGDVLKMLKALVEVGPSSIA